MSNPSLGWLNGLTILCKPFISFPFRLVKPFNSHDFFPAFGAHNDPNRTRDKPRKVSAKQGIYLMQSFSQVDFWGISGRLFGSSWLVVWSIFYFPFHIWDVIPTPLTNSDFSRWFKTTNQCSIIA